jgi:hypothetical protein
MSGNRCDRPNRPWPDHHRDTIRHATTEAVARTEVANPVGASRAIGGPATLSPFWRVQPKRPAGVVAVVAVCMLTLGSCSALQNTSTPVQPVPGGQITPLLDSTLSTPRWFTGTDGQAHLVYELMLTSVVPAPVTLGSLEVHSADSGATLIRLSGDYCGRRQG